MTATRRLLYFSTQRFSSDPVYEAQKVSVQNGQMHGHVHTVWTSHHGHHSGSNTWKQQPQPTEVDMARVCSTPKRI